MIHPQSLVLEPRAGPRARRAFSDLWRGTLAVDMWSSLAMHDIQARFRGSILGPFWISLTIAISVLGIGLLFGDLFGEKVKDFIPYVAIGLGLWSLISTTINEGCATFMAAAPLIRQTQTPLASQVWRVVLRNLVAFAHTLVFLIPLLVWSGHAFDGIWYGALAGAVLVLANLVWMVLFLGVACARFRDIQQIVSSILQMAVFISPVFWRRESLINNRFIADFNPFTHMLDAIRAPLLAPVVPVDSLIFLGIMAVLGWGLAITTFVLTRHRIVYYL